MTGGAERGAAAELDRQPRWAAARKALGEAEADALLVTEPANRRWLTGFTGSAGRVLLTEDDPPLLVTDGRYAQRAEEEAVGCEVQLDRSWGWLADRPHPPRRLAVEAEDLSWAMARELADLLPDTELVPTTGLLAGLRAIKDEHELAALRRACELTVQAFDAALEWLSPGLSERAVARRLVDTLLDLGADGPAFPPIVAAGPSGAEPHHRPTDRRLAPGELVTMDFGALVDGYHADMTRTVAMGGVRAKLRRLHDLVRVAQETGVAACRPGTPTREVDRACREIIDKAGHAEDFRHGTGHGVGLAVHEQPFLGATSAGTLAPGMTVTVEPGVYVPGLGGVRIEDVVHISPEGPRRLTTATHALLSL